MVCGSKYIDNTDGNDIEQNMDTNKIIRPTIYIVSHRFSYMDILLSMHLFGNRAKSSGTIRYISGISNVNTVLRRIICDFAKLTFPYLRLTPFDVRHKDSCTENMAKSMLNGQDVILWLNYMSKATGTYHIISKAKDLGLNPRMIYVDIDKKYTRSDEENQDCIYSSVNTLPIHKICFRTCCKSYIITSREIDYNQFWKASESNIFENFNKKLWGQAIGIQ